MGITQLVWSFPGPRDRERVVVTVKPVSSEIDGLIDIAISRDLECPTRNVFMVLGYQGTYRTNGYYLKSLGHAWPFTV